MKKKAEKQYGRMVRQVILTIFCLMLFCNPAVGKGTAAGRIIAVQGMVTIVRADGKEIKAAAGHPLQEGDQIVTGKGAKVSFSMGQTGQFKLGEDAHAILDELSGAEGEEGQSTMRLILGYLWSKLSKVGGRPAGMEIHTPTVVAGVRGTEFETVVAWDATTMIVVDDGEVEVETDDRRTKLDQGKMVQVEIDRQLAPPQAAPPRDQRDWEGWRNQKLQRLFEHLPRMAPRYAERFHRGVPRMYGFSEKVNLKGEEVRKSIEQVLRAKASGSRPKMRQAAQHFRTRVQEFRELVGQFRRGANRVLVMARFSQNLEGFATDHKARYTDQQIASIDSSLLRIARQREELKTVVQSTFLNIRRTLEQIRALREQERFIS